jgi:uncharacterized protein YbjT (DUF2867 family)
MKVLLAGANGFIGSAALARLTATGHQVLALAHSASSVPRTTLFGSVQWLAKDIARARSAEEWRPTLTGVDAVVNCAGVLQDNPWDDVQGVHARGIATLFAACEEKELRVVHVSAIGVDKRTTTNFARTKREGEDDLMRRNLPWVILRPSVVLGRHAFGGSALIRGLAALPVYPHLKDSGSLQVVQLDELCETIHFFLRPDAPSKVAFDVAGPERLTMQEIVATYRTWLGWKPARIVALPRVLSNVMFLIGDAAGFLGWRSPMRSTAKREILHGAIGDNGEWIRLTGIRPKTLRDALATEAPSVQERWFARLFFLKPLVFIALAAFWITTGLISLGPGYEIGIALLHEAGFTTLAPPLLVAGAVADIMVGIGISFRPTARRALKGAAALSLFYTVAGSVLVPRLWAEPLGPLLKIWPILVLIFVTYAIVDDR